MDRCKHCKGTPRTGADDSPANDEECDCITGEDDGQWIENALVRLYMDPESY